MDNGGGPGRLKCTTYIRAIRSVGDKRDKYKLSINAVRTNAERTNAERINAVRTNVYWGGAVRTNAVRKNTVRTNAVRTNVHVGAVRTNAVRKNTVRTNAVRTNIYWGDEVTKCGADKCIIGEGSSTRPPPNVNVYFGGGEVTSPP